jgi:hypothetical protein
MQQAGYFIIAFSVHALPAAPASRELAIGMPSECRRWDISFWGSLHPSGANLFWGRKKARS